MISRSAFAQLGYSAWLLAATAAGLLLTFAAPPALALGGSWWGAGAWAAMSLIYAPALGFYGVSPLWAPLLPVVAMFYLGATLDSAIQHWRGKGDVEGEGISGIRGDRGPGNAGFRRWRGFPVLVCGLTKLERGRGVSWD